MQTTLTVSPAVWHRYPPLAQFEPLEPRQRNLYVARASVRAALPPRFTVCDTHAEGAAFYAPVPPSPAPLHEPWQAAVLDAIRHMRRWHYYSTDAAAPALPNMPLDGCRCRVCTLRE